VSTCHADTPESPTKTRAPAAGAGNRLGQETSPYLLQHQDNPVHWRPWGPEAFAEARESGRPVLLSIGYAACHWCHVMAHESFEDTVTAALMNELFVNIKVDREERPDVDAIYQHALALMGEHGGWPLTMFLTAEAEPIWGGTYFPPEPRFGRPAFTDILQRVAHLFRTDPDKIRHNVDALKAALATLSKSARGGAVPADAVEPVAAALMRQVDRANGGLGGAPKFPQCSALEILWRAYRRSGEAAFGDAVTLSLDRMCQGGIYDHLGGGFARYSVDGAWLVPHFEKMLYDNAQLVDLMTLVWQETRSPLYAARIAETIGWLLREMVTERGGFAGTLDADSEGEEGRYYVWSAEEIEALLGDEAPFFKMAYDVRAGGNWEGKTILNRSAQPALGIAEHEARLAASRAKLLATRDQRIRPGLDDKVLADWNGLMIAALARAAQSFERPDWLDAAAAAFTFVRESMVVDGRLRHSWRAGRADHPATLDDHAAMALAALALYQATAEAGYLTQAVAWLDEAHDRFHDAEEGGYFFSADDVTDLITRSKNAYDHATPAGNAMAAAAMAQLYYLTGEAQWRERAESTITAFSGEVERNPATVAALINANDLLQNAVQIVICGETDTADTRALLKASLAVSLPTRIQQLVPPGTTLGTGHPAHGKGPLEGRAAAYVCRDLTCSLPLTDAAALAAALADGR